MHAKASMASRQAATIEMDGNNKHTCPTNAIALATNSWLMYILLQFKSI